MQVSRRTILAATLAAMGSACTGYRAPRPATPQPVILDTDIGDDIDDTWALLLLLRMPQLDLRLAVTEFGNSTYRARLLAKLLTLTGRDDVPVALGLGNGDEPGLQSGWIGEYALAQYRGEVLDDGIDAIIRTILGSAQPVTVLAIGPATNIAEALRREPAIAQNARFVGMQGSVRVGYAADPEPAIEWNVRLDPLALRAVFAAPWQCTITPLDTCGLVRVDGERYQRLYQSEDPWLQALMDNYRVWLPGAPFIVPGTTVETISTTLFDTVAVYLASDESLVNIETLPIWVTDDAYTVIDPERGRPVRCATSWRDLDAFEEFLVDTLLG